MHDSTTEIREATPADVETIIALAEAIWWPTYSPILAAEQLQYMLDTIYSAAQISKQIQNREQIYMLLLEGGEPVGFASYSPRPENADIYKLHKLYCLVTNHKRGYGKMLVQAVENAVTTAGKHILELNVNRHNPAIGFYEKLGFSIAATEDIDIGNGYWMNDYIMRKELIPEKK
jgi:diamine N-acetyltransferase